MEIMDILGVVGSLVMFQGTLFTVARYSSGDK